MTDDSQLADGTGGPDLTKALGYILKRFELGLRMRTDEHLRAFGLTSTQYGVLSVLARTDGVSTADMARYFRVTPQAMSQLVAGLERRGLVTRRTDPHHQRIMRLSLTAGGRRTQKTAETVVTQVEEDLLAALPPEERQTLLTLLWKCCGLLGVLDRPTGWENQGILPSKAMNESPARRRRRPTE